MGKRGGLIGNDLRALRLRQNVTQQQLADQIGVTRQTVNAIEGNRYSPSLEVAFRIARALGAGVEEVFSYDEG
ncbi:helix-turn-helix transcriptional regulator [Deinococcus koreensis]|uniref:Transcriptional regulator n=1 Tax=Deinococcus koreensis TaxID=2054903 RepID=A0A2K3UTE6_9DEIO|nr:helix-turn-helix transcriptional regulator [Deinococcus koreensis]PNY79801.1 transcriptional regulator [Deinococcus koreensis]